MQYSKKADMNPLQQEYFSWLTNKWLPGLLAAGAGIRGITGLGEIVNRNLKQPPTTPEPTILKIPYRARKEEEEPQPLQNKLANVFTEGLNAKSMFDQPYTWPTTIFGGAAAGLAGYGLTDKIVRMFKGKIRQDQTDAAKEEYEKAILSQFKPLATDVVKPVKYETPKINEKKAFSKPTLTKDEIVVLMTKSATTDPKLKLVSEKLDQLVDSVIEKKAIFDDAVNWAVNRGLGFYGVAAPMLAGASGLATYHYMKNRDSDLAEAEQLEKDHERRMAKQMPDIFAKLVPVDENGNVVKPQPKKINPTGPVNPDMVSEINAKAASFVNELFGKRERNR